MRRALPFLILLLAGCTNAPVAGFLDTCFPSKAKTAAPTEPTRPIAPPVGPTPSAPAPHAPDTTPIPPPADVAPRVGP